MSNLGLYQTLTSWAKKVGGPKNLILLIGGIGAGIGSAVTLCVKVLKEKINIEQERKRQTVEASVIYTVSVEGKSNEGLLFKVGDTFRVLEYDGDAGLIEKIGDKNNPYFVSLQFLSTISDYEAIKED